MIDESLEELMQQIDVKLSDHRARILNLVDESRSSREIDDNT